MSYESEVFYAEQTGCFICGQCGQWRKGFPSAKRSDYKSSEAICGPCLEIMLKEKSNEVPDAVLLL